MVGNLSAASEADLTKVTQALEEYRMHWRSFTAMPDYGNFFDGRLDDIEALDYLDYEGLGYPASGLEGAALIVGNVLAKNLSMTWVVNRKDDMLLIDPSESNMAVWPFARVLEVQVRSLPQFDKYSWVLCRLLREFTDCGCYYDETEQWINQALERLSP